MARRDTSVGYKGGRRCVAGGCSGMNSDGLNLHHFPFDRPVILRQWVQFVQQRRKDWLGPTKFSVLCSLHFTEDAYPMKYRILESSGVTVKRRELFKDAVPTIQSQTLGKRTASPDGNSPMCSTPKKPRRAFLKRESERILMEYDNRDGMEEEDVTEVPPICSEDQAVEEVESRQPVVKETRTVGSQLSLPKPQRRSDSTQTKWKSHDKVVQVGNTIRTRDVAISCNLLAAPPLRCALPPPRTMPEVLQESFASEETTDEEEDLDSSVNSFPSVESEESLEMDNRGDQEQKFIIYESQLMELFASCPSCANPTFGEIQHVKGTFVAVKQDCGFCNLSRTWSSQPFIGAIPAGNFHLSCALLFSGALPTKTIRMFQFMNLACISNRTFMYHQKSYLHPTILSVWNDSQASYFRNVLEAGEPLHLGGDGRADTPGHSAKFGSYTLMDLEKNQIVDLQLVQSNEVRSSCHMEKEGLVRSVRHLEEAGIEISHLVTDRHLQVAKWVRENMPGTTHSIDVWHVAKSLKKRLVALSKEKDCEVLTDWIRSIINHLYWVPSSTPEDDHDLRLEKWASISNHIQNVHEGHGPNFLRCEHEEISMDGRRKRWLRPGTKVTEKLEALLSSRQMKKDIPRLSSNLQTSNLEAYHSIINHFAPKMNQFSYHGMQSRLILAALHFNENASKEQAATLDGTLQYKITFPKQKKGEFTVKKVKRQSTFDYVHSLIDCATEKATNTTMPRCEDGPGAAPPPLCQQFPHPDKEEAVNQLMSRFRRN